MGDDERVVIDLCRGVKTCEEAVLKLLLDVYETRTRDGSAGTYCMQFMSAFKSRCGCKQTDTEISLTTNCKLEFLIVYPWSKLLEWHLPPPWLEWKRVVPTRKNYLGLITNSFSEHAVGRFCCQYPGEQPTCMYFDIGSENRNGQYGGDDRWFPPYDEGFVGEINQREMDIDLGDYFDRP